MREDWEIRKLGDICKLYQPKTISNKEFIEDGEYPVYGSNGIIGQYNQYNHATREILISCRGTCGKVNVSRPYSWINGNAMVVHITRPAIVFDFLKYQLMGVDMSEAITGATIPQITRQSLTPIKIALPPIQTQEKIVAELDCLTGIIEKKKQQLEELDKLAQSIFYDMFGEPTANTMMWEQRPFKDIADFKNGANFTKTTSGQFSVKFLSVADFGDKTRIEGKQLGFITIDEQISDELYLKNDDIVFVRSNGNKALIGRSALIIIDNEAVSYSGFCIRARLRTQTLNPTFMSSLLNIPSVRKTITSSGQGCNISNLNQKSLGELSIILPPLDSQNEFAQKIEAIEKQKELVKRSIVETEMLFKSRMDYWFD